MSTNVRGNSSFNSGTSCFLYTLLVIVIANAKGDNSTDIVEAYE